MKRAIIAVLAGGLLSATAIASPAVAAVSPQDAPRCARDDLPCRIDRLERSIDYLIDLMEERADRPGGRGGRVRTQDMAVNQDCTFESCASIALRLCQNAGFQRGVAAELGQNGAWQRLVRAQCSD